MVGIWEGNDGHRYLKLTVGEDTLDLNGVAGEIIADFADYGGGVRGRVTFGDTTYYVDYVDNGEDRYVALTSGNTVATLYPEGSVDTPLPPLPSSFVGTWKGMDLDTMVEYTLVVDSDGIPTLNGTRGDVQFISESGANASILFGEELYELTLSSNGILLERADHAISAVLTLEEPEEPDEPAILVPEAAWIGVWKDAEHTIEITADGLWSVDGEYASNVEKSGEYYSVRIGKLSESTLYQLSLIEEGGKTAMLAETLSSSWTLYKEGAETPALELPADWVGTWTGTFGQMDIALTIAEDGTITILGTVAEGAAYDEETGTLSITFMSMPATATLEWNQGIYEIHVAVMESELVLRKDGEAPVTLPAGWVGEWSGTIMGMPIVLNVADDMTITMGEEVLTGWTYDAAADELHIEYSSMAIVAGLVEESGVTKIAIKMADMVLGYLEKVVDTPAPAVEVPEILVGTWESNDGAHTLVLNADGTATYNGEAVTLGEITANSDGGYEGSFEGADCSFELTFYNDSWGESIELKDLNASYTYYYLYRVAEEPEPEPTVEIPEGMIGTWSATELGKTYELVVTADTITLNGVEGTGLTAFEEDSYGDLVAHIYFDGVEHSIAYSAGSGFTPSVILDNLETSSPYDYPYLKKVEVEEPQPEEPDEPAIAIPEGYDGTYEGSSGDQTFTLVVEGDKITLNGVEGTITELKDAGYAWTGKVDFGGTVYGIEFSENFDNELIISINCSDPYLYWTTLDKVVDTTEPEEPSTELPFPADIVGTWTGEDLYSGETMTLVLGEDGTVTYNGTVATNVTTYNEETGKFTFTIDGSRYSVTVNYGVGGLETKLMVSCMDGLMPIQGELTK